MNNCKVTYWKCFKRHCNGHHTKWHIWGRDHAISNAVC